jgi:hypothetical protein
VIEQLGRSVRVAKRLEENKAMSAPRDDVTNDWIRTKLETLEGAPAVLVMDFELGPSLKPAGEHVRARALQSDDEHRNSRGRYAVGTAPPPLLQGTRGPLDGVYLIFFDEPTKALLPRPPPMISNTLEKPGQPIWFLEPTWFPWHTNSVMRIWSFCKEGLYHVVREDP